MLLHGFPDLYWLKKQAEDRFANRQAWNSQMLTHAGWPTVILNVKAGETYRDNIPGPISLFSTISGVSQVEVDGRNVSIDEDYFFLTNASQRYTLEIEKKNPSVVFNIHFGEQWAEETFVTLYEQTEKLIDVPDNAQYKTISFFNKLYFKDETIKSIQQKLLAAKEEGQLRQDELLFDLMSHLLQQQKLIKQDALAIPTIKMATREEILKRLFLATNYIYTFYDRTITLDDLARVSCLSKFHFLRLFKQFFQQTPHQFITELRIKKAIHLLKNPQAEVKQVARQLGFENSSSFSRLFYNQTGSYPSQTRSFQLLS
jgi:AraC family transcriptional regulator